MHCTRHRVFLATLIVAAKYLNDSSPKNKHWTKYGALFSQAEVNLMEKQLLYLLDYDLRMEEDELMIHFAPFFRRTEDRAEAGRREMHLRGCEAGRERERYARASEKRIYLRSLPASEVPCWNTSTTTEKGETVAPSNSKPILVRAPSNAPPSPVSPSPKVRSLPKMYRPASSSSMSRQQSSDSTGSSASSEADLTDDNGSSSSSAEDYDDEYDDEDEDEEYYEQRLDERMQQMTRNKSQMMDVEMGDGSKVGTAMHRYIASALPTSLKKGNNGSTADVSVAPSSSMRSVRSSSNLLSRMLGHQTSSY